MSYQMTNSTLEKVADSVYAIRSSCTSGKKAVGCSVEASGLPAVYPMVMPNSEDGCLCNQVEDGATCRAVCY